MRWGPQNKLQKTLNVLMLTTLFLTGGLFKFQLPKANGRQKAETVGDLLVPVEFCWNGFHATVFGSEVCMDAISSVFEHSRDGFFPSIFPITCSGAATGRSKRP